MARLAFARERRGMYRSNSDTDIVGIATFPEKIWTGVKWELFPNVGVRHEGINRLLYELSDLAEPNRSLGVLRANLLTNIGYLMPAPGFRGWSFPLDSDPDPPLQDMVTAIETHGLPFIRSLSDSSKFCEALASGKFSLVNRDRDLPVCHFVMADDVAAEKCLDQGVKDRAGRHDPEAEQYRLFATRLRQLILERKKKEND